MTNSEIIEIVQNSKSKSEIARKLGFNLNGSGFRKLSKLLSELNITPPIYKKEYTYPIITKICPVCEEEFETQLGISKEKTVCSYACSNSYFRSGENHPNWKEVNVKQEKLYRKICFKYHKKECIICKEDKIVEVHHLDENNKNHNPENLIPLCPTHHQYWHSRYKYLVEEQVQNYISNWKSSNNSNNINAIINT